MDELAAVLQASKGSISTATRLLIRLGVVERVALPGQRRDHFRVRPGAWNTLNRAQVPRLTALRELAERGLDVLAGAPAAETSRLTEMRDIFAWLERELPMLMDRYDEGRAGGLSEGAT
jgi:DNA-binding transcriptional regulator GbsR (MarR family)